MLVLPRVLLRQCVTIQLEGTLLGMLKPKPLQSCCIGFSPYLTSILLYSHLVILLHTRVIYTVILTFTLSLRDVADLLC